MYEYEIINNTTAERTFIWGYSYEDAFNRNSDMDKADWTCIHADFVD